MRVPDRNTVRITGLAYEGMDSCRADWLAAKGETADVPAEVEVPSVAVPEMHDMAVVVEKVPGKNEDVGSVHRLLAKSCGQYLDGITAFK